MLTVQQAVAYKCSQLQTHEGGIGHVRLLAEVPSTSVEYCEVYKIPSRVGFPQVPGSTVFTYPVFSGDSKSDI